MYIIWPDIQHFQKLMKYLKNLFDIIFGYLSLFYKY
jgi:hypothetical protein